MSASRAESDYGSDFGDEVELELRDLLHGFESNSQQRNGVAANTPAALAGMPTVLLEHDMDEYGWREGGIEVLEDDAGILIMPREVDDSQSEVELTQYQSEHGFGTPAVKEDADDKRSPLERFRSKKPLSVSDLVAPAWCEIQYWYSLTKYGRKKRTAAMKQGSVVHKKLEEETMGVAEPVETQTREDGFGLRLWNIIQSLRLLRATGMTRELEVWGFVDGQLVNGVIDELSFTSTDVKLEESLSSNSQSQSKRRRKQPELDDLAKQPTIAQFFASGSQVTRQSLETAVDSNRKLYLTDVKTRVGTSLPAAPSLRPTKMQLMLYRRLLADLASNNVDAMQVFARYRLDHTAELSDLFLQSMTELDTNLGPGIADNAFAEVQTMSSTMVELLSHRTLPLLWQLMVKEYAATLPLGGTNISRVLRAQFVSQRDQKVIGDKTFAYDDKVVEEYIADGLRWWKGERAARGVEIEEAFKCGICEFAEGCEWRQGKVDEAVKRRRGKSTKEAIFATAG